MNILFGVVVVVLVVVIIESIALYKGFVALAGIRQEWENTLHEKHAQLIRLTQTEKGFLPGALIVANNIHNYGEAAFNAREDAKTALDHNGDVLSFEKVTFLWKLGMAMRLMTGLYRPGSPVPIIDEESIENDQRLLFGMRHFIEQYDLLGFTFSDLFMIAEEVLSGADVQEAIDSMRKILDNPEDKGAVFIKRREIMDKHYCRIWGRRYA